MSKTVDKLEMKNWQIFLNTIAGNKEEEIKVEGISGSNIQFKAPENIVKSLLEKLANPSKLKETIIHAIPSQKNLEKSNQLNESQITIINKTPDHIINLFKKSGLDILESLLSKKILSNLDLKSFSPQNTPTGSLIFELNNDDLFFTSDLEKFKILKQLLSDKDEIVRKLEKKELGEEEKISSKSRLEKNSDIILINTGSSKTEIIFNKIYYYKKYRVYINAKYLLCARLSVKIRINYLK